MEMKINKRKAVSLLELLLVICFLGIVFIGVSTINIFFWRNINTIQRRTEVQNDVIFVLSHIRKTALRAVGDKQEVPIDFSTNRIWVDRNANARRDVPPDEQVAYTYNAGTRTLSLVGVSSTDVISKKIRSFSMSAGATVNSFQVAFIDCWDPYEKKEACGRLENPQMNVTMQLTMPMVSFK